MESHARILRIGKRRYLARAQDADGFIDTTPDDWHNSSARPTEPARCQIQAQLICLHCGCQHEEIERSEASQAADAHRRNALAARSAAQDRLPHRRQPLDSLGHVARRSRQGLNRTGRRTQPAVRAGSSIDVQSTGEIEATDRTGFGAGPTGRAAQPVTDAD
jgi:hypothetical protein